MKLLFLSLLSTLLLKNVPGTQVVIEKVPEKVTNAFASRYPSVQVRNWVVKNNVYTATFIWGDKKNTACFDSACEWIKTETMIPGTKALPAAVKQGFLKSQFAIWYIEKMGKHETAKKTLFRFFMNNGNLLDGDHHDAFLKKCLLDFSTDGELLHKEMLQ
jgi:hypothetical protein